MYRFVALIWNPVDESKTASARTLAMRLQSSSTDWHCVLKCSGLEVYHAGVRVGATEAYQLQGDTGVVVGKLFHRAEQDPIRPSSVILDGTTSQTIIDSQAKHLADDFWGRYVAFIWNGRRREHYVFRDPSGGLPCIFTKALGVTVFTSDLEDYIPLEAGERAVNWNYVAALFWNHRRISRDTGFEEVSSVHAGECMTIKDGTVTAAFRWDPTQIYAAGPLLEEPGQARAALRSAVRNSVLSWASCHQNIIHLLSGGLDSSIVASCLGGAHNKQNIVCVNMSAEIEAGDERDFARLAARKAGLELIEGQWRLSDLSLEELLDKGKHAAAVGLHSETDRLLQRLTLERGATAVFTGKGGDHFFQCRRSPFIAAEFVSCRGLRSELATIVADTSRLTKKSVWSIFGTALSYGLVKRNFDPSAENKQSVLLTDEARAALSPDSLIHPWVAGANGMPASKIEQIYTLVDSQHFNLRPYHCSADTVHPLISQPIIECCLRIPTYVMVRGGVNRALVREAFKDVLPSEIVARITKGGTTGYLNRLAVDNARFLRDYLLDGMLVSAHVLKKQELEKQLSEQMLIRGEFRRDILIAARIEAWLRSWGSVWQKAAA